MSKTINKSAGERTQAVPITWTGDARRIARLFCRYDSDIQTLRIHYPLGDIVVEHVNNELMDPCGLVGMKLAGRNLGETEKLIKELNLQA